ncbi:uncharacterized protein TEOVI_000161800 [Trypanosoma equiperdum]|uniref:Uncharacterized protein n=2 Tax=Trypanozoon TaxID=39700 RepID=Q57YQ6_TRYB2|nr:hypothetical protein, conserved [Trypanosoma brucei brucei TREU927]AAX69268.1 hypothetical protein, conserved [Trypanosoma brucei]AAZ13463.1 hypothetical protein, conserved [Trypanosoma brucei brucei TREU927]SCU70049.1 hypothetical protein, conserved [Trypanosoma equiperdum]
MQGSTEKTTLEERMIQRRSSLPSLQLPSNSSIPPLSKNSSFAEGRVVSDPKLWTERFNDVFHVPPAHTSPEANCPRGPNKSEEKSPTPEVTCCGLFF